MRNGVIVLILLLTGCHQQENVVSAPVIQNPPGTTQQPTKDLLPPNDADIPATLHIPAAKTK